MKENRPIYSYVRVMQKQADSAISRVIDYTNNPQGYEECINMTMQYMTKLIKLCLHAPKSKEIKNIIQNL